MDLERDFTAWTDTRDAEALTRVFDATAGRLLLLAMHIAGPAGTAEDLVQATFLAAMARSSTWDRARPLWPWLAAILQNEAHMQWRRQRRRREVGIDAAADAAATAADPARLAASDEAFTAVVAAIDVMPLPYRQVLRLRLLHGLQPIEIARALEVPVGTVRAQVHRGLAQLRDALPVGVATVVGAWLMGEGALLAQVRARVLAEAGAVPASAASLLLTGGWWIMHGKTIGLVAAGAALLLFLGIALGVPSIFGAGSQQAVQPVPAVGNLASDTTRKDTVTDDKPDRRVAEASGPAWPLVVTVRASGEPLAHASVHVWVAARGILIQNREQGEVMRRDVGSGETGPDGTFHCSLDAFRECSALLRRTSYVFVTATQSGTGAKDEILSLPRTTEPRPFQAEIELSPAGGIVGRLVDSSGAPVPNAWLYSLAPTREQFESAFVRSGEDGMFCVRTTGDRERWPVRVAAVDPRHGVAVADVPRLEAATPTTTTDLGTLVFEGRDAISGQVVLGDGAPLAYYPMFIAEIDPELAADPVAIEHSFYKFGKNREPVELRRNRLVQVVSSPVTLANGSFVCAGLDPEAVYAVAVRDVGLRMVLAVARVGDKSIRLVVERQLLVLDVRDEAGEALQGARILAEGYDPENKNPSYKIRPGFPAIGLAVGNPTFAVDARGRLMLLSKFGWTWRIGVSDEIAQEDCIRHEVVAGVYRAERNFVLRSETHFGSLHLVVVDEHGEPLPNYGACLRNLDRDLQYNDSRMIPPAGGMKWELPAGRWRLKVLLGNEVIYAPALEAYARGSHEQIVVVEDGRVAEVKVEAKPAGLVGFRLHSDTPPEGGKWDELKIQAEPGAVEVPWLAHDELQPYMDGPVPAYGLLFVGKTAFAPGKHAFLITAKGFNSVRRDVEVAADRLNSVEVEMIRQ